MPSFTINSLKLTAILLFCFSLNIVSHGSILLGAFNTLLLGLVLLFFQNFSGKKILSIQFPFIVLLGTMPLFTHYYKDILIVFFAIGIILLFLIYIKVRFKFFLIFTIFLYISIATLYAGEIIRLPLSFQSDWLIFSNTWTNQAIAGMQKEALYIPYSIRPIIFSKSAYLYVMLSRFTDLFMINKISNVLLLANLYPLVKGIILYLNPWDKKRSLIILSFFLISFIAVTSRAIDVFNIFLLLSPFLVYFILLGIGSINKRVYFSLIILSFFLVTSPLK